MTATYPLIELLRTALSDALSGLGFSISFASAAIGAGSPLMAVDVQELRQGVK